MSKFARIFGFDKRKAWWYRDLELITVAGITALYVAVAVTEERSAFNLRLAIGAAVVAILCWLVTPNRAILFGAVVGIVALFYSQVTTEAFGWPCQQPSWKLGSYGNIGGYPRAGRFCGYPVFVTREDGGYLENLFRLGLKPAIAACSISKHSMHFCGL